MVDEGLRSAHAILRRNVMPDSTETWFKRSVLEVMLEEVFRKNLHNLAMTQSY